MSVNLHLQNLPRAASNLDIRNFFSGLDIPEGGVQIVGGPDGDAFIAFRSQNDLLQAIMRDGQLLNGQAVKLKLASRDNMEQVINKRKLDLAEARRLRALNSAPPAKEFLPRPDVGYREHAPSQFSHHLPSEQYQHAGDNLYAPISHEHYPRDSREYYPPHGNHVQYELDPHSGPVSIGEFPPVENLIFGDVPVRVESTHHYSKPGHNVELPHQSYISHSEEYNRSSNIGDDLNERVDRVLRDSIEGRDRHHSESLPIQGLEDEPGYIREDIDSSDKGDLRQFIGLVKRKAAAAKGVPPWIKRPKNKPTEVPPWEKHVQSREDASPPPGFDEAKGDLVVSINQFGEDRVVQNLFEPEPNMEGNGRGELETLMDEMGAESLESFSPGREQTRVEMHHKLYEDSAKDKGKGKGDDRRHRSERVNNNSNGHARKKDGGSHHKPHDDRSQDHSSAKKIARSTSGRSKHGSEKRSRSPGSHHHHHKSPERRHSRSSPERKRHSSEKHNTSPPRRGRSAERRSRSPEPRRHSYDRGHDAWRRSPERRSRSPSPPPPHHHHDHGHDHHHDHHPKRWSPPPAHQAEHMTTYDEPTRYATVTNVAVTVTARDLREFFRICAIPEGGVILRSGKDDLDALVAHIKFVHSEDTKEAVALNGKMLHGRQVTIVPASPVEFNMNKPAPRARQRSYSRSRSRSWSRSRSRSRSSSRSRSGSPYRSRRRSRPRMSPRTPPHGGFPPYPMNAGQYGMYPRGPVPAHPPSHPMWGPRPGFYGGPPMGVPYPVGPVGGYPGYQHPQPHPPPQGYPPYPPQHYSPPRPIPAPSHRPDAWESSTKLARRTKAASRGASSNIDVIKRHDHQKKDSEKKKAPPSNSSQDKKADSAKKAKPPTEDVKKLNYIRMTNLPPGTHAWELRRSFADMSVPTNGVTLVRHCTGTAWFAYVKFTDSKHPEEVLRKDHKRERNKQRDVKICSESSLQLELHRLKSDCQVLRSKGEKEDEVIIQQRTSSGSTSSDRASNKKTVEEEPSLGSLSSNFSDSLDEDESFSSPEKPVKMPGILIKAKNFPLTISEEEAEEFFSSCKPIKGSTRKSWDKSGNVIINVRFVTQVSAEYAVLTMNKKTYEGKPISVAYPRTKKKH